MSAAAAKHDMPWGGRVVVITRPVGAGGQLARRVRIGGGTAVLLPGLSLRPIVGDPTMDALRAALSDELLLFTSPAAVRFAARLLPLHTDAVVLAVGQGTARALRRHGVSAPLVPTRADSEGLLAHSQLADIRGRRVALIGAAGGRGVLRRGLKSRGAGLREVHVYQRGPARLDRRHLNAVLRLPSSACVLLSSAEALGNLMQQLPPAMRACWLATIAVVSSPRLAAAARDAGFQRIVQARSALSEDMLDAALIAR